MPLAVALAVEMVVAERDAAAGAVERVHLGTLAPGDTRATFQTQTKLVRKSW